MDPGLVSAGAQPGSLVVAAGITPPITLLCLLLITTPAKAKVSPGHPGSSITQAAWWTMVQPTKAIPTALKAVALPEPGVAAEQTMIRVRTTRIVAAGVAVTPAPAVAVVTPGVPIRLWAVSAVQPLPRQVPAG